MTRFILLSGLLACSYACSVEPGGRATFGVGADADDETSATDDETSGADDETAPPPEAIEAAYRITQLAVADPRAYMVLGDDCKDVTPLLESSGLQQPIDDGELDVVIRLMPSEDGSQHAVIGGGACEEDVGCGPAPEGPGADPAAAELVGGGSCDVAEPDAFNPDYGEIPTTPAPCVLSQFAAFELDLGADTPVQLRALKWTASLGEASLSAGLLRAFVARDDAEAVELDVGGADDAVTLWSLIAGGDACIESTDDTDEHPEHGAGVWLHLAFEARQTEWTE